MKKSLSIFYNGIILFPKFYDKPSLFKIVIFLSSLVSLIKLTISSFITARITNFSRTSENFILPCESSSIFNFDK